MPNLDNCSYCYIKVKELNLNLFKQELLCNKCNSGDSILINKNQIVELKKIITTHIKKIDTLELNENNILLINDFLFEYGKIFLHGFNNMKSLKLINHG